MKNLLFTRFCFKLYIVNNWHYCSQFKITCLELNSKESRILLKCYQPPLIVTTSLEKVHYLAAPEESSPGKATEFFEMFKSVF